MSLGDIYKGIRINKNTLGKYDLLQICCKAKSSIKEAIDYIDKNNIERIPYRDCEIVCDRGVDVYTPLVEGSSTGVSYHSLENAKEWIDSRYKQQPQPPFSRPYILGKAREVVEGQRQEDYGSPAQNHTRTADLWGAYLGIPLTPEDICMLNILQKVSRFRHSPKEDNLIDIAGYAQCAQWVLPQTPKENTND